MIEKILLENILFLDIETVPEASDYNELDAEMKALWEHKTQYQRKEEYTPEDFYDRAGIWAEFGKIVCISVGYFAIKGDEGTHYTPVTSGVQEHLAPVYDSFILDLYNGAGDTNKSTLFIQKLKVLKQVGKLSKL